MEPERFKERFGTMAVKKGFVTAGQIIEAMNIQIMNDIDNQEHRLIGTILFEQGHITLSQLQEVLDVMNQ